MGRASSAGICLSLRSVLLTSHLNLAGMHLHRCRDFEMATWGLAREQLAKSRARSSGYDSEILRGDAAGLRRLLDAMEAELEGAGVARVRSDWITELRSPNFSSTDPRGIFSKAQTCRILFTGSETFSTISPCVTAPKP